MRPDLRVIRRRLIKARLATWAGDGPTYPQTTTPGATRYIWVSPDGRFRYDDEYISGKSGVFQGREHVYWDGVLVWGMVYRGQIFAKKRLVNAFLRKVMVELANTARSGDGLTYFDEGVLSYEASPSDSEQSFGGFDGEEIICEDHPTSAQPATELYQGIYSGGWIL